MKIDRSIILIIIIILFSFNMVTAQEPPPTPISVTVAGPLIFGAFTPGNSGGHVTITATSAPSGVRSADGTVILINLSYSFSAALYQISGNDGTLITITNGSSVSLTRAGGGSLTLQIGDSYPASPFVLSVPPVQTDVYVGGTLTVGNISANPPGSYSGTFRITLDQN
jgi:hypothetical protein